MDDDQQFCLRWNNHQSTLVAVFDTLLENGTLVDCTLAAEGKYLNAHKVVLSACSPYFEALLSKHFDKHPIVVLKDVKFQELKAMMDYMYRGEVNISQDQLGALLKAAESLQIKGLSDNKRGETERKPVPAAAAPPAPKSPPPAPAVLPKVQGLTIEQRASRDDSRDGSASPGPRKKKRMRRKSEELDNHDASNSSESHSLPAAQTPLLPAKDTPEPVETKSEILTRHKQPDEMLPQVPILKEKMETHTELMLEPKSEYVDEMNEDSIEDLTLDDDDLSNMEQMDDQAGPSHGNAGEGSSQGFGGWHMGNQSQDEVFLAAQEAVGAHRDSQDIINMEMNDPDQSSYFTSPFMAALGASPTAKTASFIRRIEEFESEPEFVNKKRTVTSQSRIMISPDNLLDHLLSVTDGKEIIRYYKKYNCLNDSYRKKLVNVCVDYLNSFFGGNCMPSTYSREELAKSIVVVFPKLKDPDSPEGYEAFYEPATQKGFITTRLRTIFRKSKNSEIDNSRQTGKQSVEFEQSLNADEQEKLVEMMKFKDGGTDCDEIFEITKKTFSYRRKTGCSFNKYPRFFDTKGLISLEFKMMYPNAKNLSDTFPIYVNKIFEVYHRTIHSKSEEITTDIGDNAWSKLVRSFFCILHILPPSARGRHRETAISAQRLFVHFQKSDVPIDEIMKTKTINQPFLLAVGPSRRYCENYYLVFHDRIIPISNMTEREPNFLKAVDILIKTHFVFNIEYNIHLRSFYDFMSTFFYEINDGISITSRMREFRCKLKN